MPRDGLKLASASEPSAPTTSPVLAIGLGRGGSGKSTGLAELVWRAKNAGRSVIVADGDTLSKTLTDTFPGEVTSPGSDQFLDVRSWLNGLLSQVGTKRQSAVLDLGGGDRMLQEYGRKLPIVEFCSSYGIDPVAIYYLGPSVEDLRHVLAIWSSGHFRPERTLLMLNEGVIDAGSRMADAFAATLRNPDFIEMLKSGAKPIVLPRLECMEEIKASRLGFHDATGPNVALDIISKFQLGIWLRDLEAKRAEADILSWLP